MFYIRQRETQAENVATLRICLHVFTNSFHTSQTSISEICSVRFLRLQNFVVSPLFITIKCSVSPFHYKCFVVSAFWDYKCFVVSAFETTNICSVRFLRLQMFCSVRFFRLQMFCSVRFFRLQMFVVCFSKIL